jgi:hypothetical protein
MTEKKLIEEFLEMCRFMVPYNKPAFEAYIKGQAEWPAGTRYDKDRYKDEISDEFGGPNDALALRMRIALARSWDISEVAPYIGGVRSLAAIGVPLEKVYKACTNKAWYQPGYEAGLYYEDTASFVDSHLKKVKDPLYFIIIAMVIALLEKEPQKYARYIPALESFIKDQFDEADTAVRWSEERHEQLRTACFAFARGTLCSSGLGKLSPNLQKLELRLMLDVDRAGHIGTKEETIEAAKRLNLPPEWFELNTLIQYDHNENASLADHFKKLFTEDRPLFNKVHRAFYSTWDLPRESGFNTDPIHPRTRKSQFLNSLKLLAVKLAHGEGKEDCSPLGELDDLKKNWTKYMPVEELKKDGLPNNGSNDFIPYSLLYEYGIEPLEALFSKYFERDTIRGFFVARKYWAAPIGAIKTFIAGNPPPDRSAAAQT